MGGDGGARTELGLRAGARLAMRQEERVALGRGGPGGGGGGGGWPSSHLCGLAAPGSPVRCRSLWAGPP